MTEKTNSLARHLVSLVVMTAVCVLLILAGIILTALFSFDPSDPAWSHNNGGVVKNTLGVAGAWYSDLSFSLLGKLAYLIPIAFISIAINALIEKRIDKELTSWRLFALVTGVLSGCVLWAKHDLEPINTVAHTGGGALGMWFVAGLEKSIHSIPVIMFFALVVFVISITLLLNIPWLKIAEFIGSSIALVFGLLFSGLALSQYKQSTLNSEDEDISTGTSSEKKSQVQKQVDIVEELAAKEISIPTPIQESDNQLEQRSFTIDRYNPDSEDEALLPPRYNNSSNVSVSSAGHTDDDTLVKNNEVSSDDNLLDLSAFGLTPPKKKKAENEDNDLSTLETNSGSASILEKGLSIDDSFTKQDDIPLYDFSGKENEPENQEDIDLHKAEPSFFNFNKTRKPYVKIRENDISELAADSYDCLLQQPAESIAPYDNDTETKLQNFDMPANHVAKDIGVATFTLPERHHDDESSVAELRTSADLPMHSDDMSEASESSTNESVHYSDVFSEAATPTLNSDINTNEQLPEHNSHNDNVVTQPIISSAPIDTPVLTPEPVLPVKSEPQENYIAPHSVSTVAERPVKVIPAQTQYAPQTQVSQPITTTQQVAPPESQTSATIGKVFDKEELTDVVMPRPHEFPGFDLLDNPPPQDNAYTEDVLAQMATVLENTLKQFNVVATVMHVSPGPVITRFEVDLAPGIQAKKITNLSQDLARALAVSRVRVEEVIVGSSYVGLEVPNQSREIVYFKDIVRSKAFQNSKSPLTISLGSDTSGKPVVADLMKMPHALVAGTTGSGKSVCINVMLLSMLYKASPKDLRLILVDPKMLEMSMYEDIPHLLTPVITDMNEAENALTWAVAEMERRYQLMAALKVRKIDAFNENVDRANACGEPIKDPLWQPDEQVGYTHHPDLERLPFIVIVIDELADMMMVVGKQVEQLIARLTQKARAAGIHVVLATQRPSTDVLTGLIKANVPTRIAFQVSSGTDSRVIIDSVGAEKLLGHGDMLFVPPGASHPQRLHGAFVGDAETDRITDFLRSTGEPNYIDGITRKQDPQSLGAFGAAEAAESKEDADPLYQEAVQLVLQSGKASISSVQRQLRIGYNRAARMIEDMQEQGIVSEPVNGVRKVLAAPLPKDSI